MSATTRDLARAAKQRFVKDYLPALKLVAVGVGLTSSAAGYAIKVNLREEIPADTYRPTEVDGVDVVYEVVGPMFPRIG